MSVHSPDSPIPPLGEGPLNQEQVDHLIEAMILAWRQGQRPPAEELLARHPELLQHPEAAIRLVYEEFCLRQELGQKIDSDEVLRRFPQWHTQLKVLLDCHRLLESGHGVPTYPKVGETLGDFQLLSVLGQGAVGHVFLANQPSLADRLVVLKTTPCIGQEHLSLARLQHTHIVPLYCVLDYPERNLRALCMPYLGGATLSHLFDGLRRQPLERRTGRQLVTLLDQAQRPGARGLLSQGPARKLLARLSYPEAMAWIGACLADALHYAHERGLVHLDLKPSNVLLASDGQPMLLDFHLAQEPIRPDGPAPEWVGGTLDYMSPEQQRAVTAVSAGRSVPDCVDGRSDLYSLGLVLHEALCDQVPHQGQEPLKRLDRCNRQVSPGLADIVQHCLESEPRQRYPDATTLAADLRRHLADLPLRGVPNRSLAERWRKWRRRQTTGGWLAPS